MKKKRIKSKSFAILFEAKSDTRRAKFGGHVANKELINYYDEPVLLR